MKKILILLIFCFCAGNYANAQRMLRPSQYEIDRLPVWSQKMYGLNPNVYEVDSLYKNYYRNHAFEKSYHTQYYKRWRRSIADFIDDNGYVRIEELNRP